MRFNAPFRRVVAALLGCLLVGDVVALATIDDADIRTVAVQAGDRVVPTTLPPPVSLRGQILYISREVQPPPTSGPVTPSGAGYNLWVMAGDGSNRRPLTNTSFDTQPSLSPDGRAVAWVRANREIWTMRADGGASRLVHQCPFGCHGPRWSPDGKSIALVSIDASAEHRGTVTVIGADGSNPRAYPEPSFSAYSADWSPDGTRLAVNVSWSPQIGLLVLDVRTAEFRRIRSEASLSPAWAPGGDAILFSDNTKLWAVAPDGTSLRQVSPNASAGQYTAGRWSPDGRSIVYDFFAQQRGVLQQVGLMNADGSGARLLTDGTFEAYEATF